MGKALFAVFPKLTKEHKRQSSCEGAFVQGRVKGHAVSHLPAHIWRASSRVPSHFLGLQNYATSVPLSTVPRHTSCSNAVGCFFFFN